MANKYTNRELLDYNFNENDYEDVSLAKQTANDALNKYNSVGDWKYGKEDQYSKALDALTNRKAFSYDLNGDALYQQYKDNYIQQGKMAMQDAMGQAAAMTGGYGNSYAATVGNQAYQGYLQGLNDKVPELYQLAMQRYNMEGDNLKAAYDVLKGDRDSDYGMFMDNKTMLQNDVQLYNNLYDAAYTREQTNYNNTLSSNNDNYWNEYNTGYQAEQDAFANDLALKQLKMQQDSQKIAELQAGVVRDKNGNIVSVSKVGSSGGSTSDIPDDVKSKAASFKTDDELENYLNSITGVGITEEQADTLYATYKKGIPTIDAWELVNNGGVNGFFGIGKWFNNVDDDAQAKFKNADGTYTTYRMDDLSKYLQDNGYSKDEAIAYIKKLQTKVGIN